MQSWSSGNRNGGRVFVDVDACVAKDKVAKRFTAVGSGSAGSPVSRLVAIVVSADGG